MCMNETNNEINNQINHDQTNSPVFTDENYQELSNDISDNILNQLPDEKLKELDELLEMNPEATEQDIEKFLIENGIDVNTIALETTQNFLHNQ